MATCIAALVCGAPWLDEPARGWALRIADDWNSRIEDWTAVHDTTLATRAMAVAGYYVRIAPPVGRRWRRNILSASCRSRITDVTRALAAEDQVATDFLQLVRLGLRDANDSLVVDTLKVIDDLLEGEYPLRAGLASLHR